MTNLLPQRFVYKIANRCWADPNKGKNGVMFLAGALNIKAPAICQGLLEG
jgi:hypothetical protein